MGLLNVARKLKLNNFLATHHRAVILLSYFSGIMWFVALTFEGLNNRTYFSENALLPGVVDRDFNSGSHLNGILESLKEESSVHSGVPRAWIKSHFRQAGLDVFIQNFTLNYPFGLKSKHSGVNIYGILRASKSSSIESLVLSTPYRGLYTIHDSTLPSIVLMIELAKYFRRHTYWSKDIVFLITEHENVGFQAWLNAYHNIVSDVIESDSLDGYTGLIQGVVNLEVSSEQFSSIDVKIEGINGELPNLDLFNLATELCAREGIFSTFHSYKTLFSVRDSFSYNAWKQNLITMMSMMSLQATGLTNGGHGLFHRYGIQAITLRSVSDESKKISLIHAGRVVEGIFRSLNNLLEKFHQSFFFYLLSSTKRYISIGLYMPPFVLIALPILVKALHLYMQTRLVFSKLEDLNNIGSSVSLFCAVDMLIISYSLGTLTYYNQIFIDVVQNVSELSVEDSLYIAHVISLYISMSIIYFYCKKIALTKNEYNVKLCVSLLNLAAFLYSLSLMNISMATILALLYVLIGVSLHCNIKYYSIYYGILLIINPYVIIYIINIIQSVSNEPHVTLDDFLVIATGFQGHKKVLLYTLEDMYIYNNWNYKIFTLALLPVWYQFWILVTYKCS